jgi:GTPase
MEAE